MATHPPIRALRSLRRKCLFDRPNIRAFSSTKPQSKLLGDRALNEALAREQQKQSPAPSVSMARNMKEGDSLPEDIGMLSGHIVLPSWKNLPPFLNNKNFYWKYIISKPIGLYSRIQYQWTKKTSPRPSINFMNGAPIKDQAEKLYTKIYESYASGDRKTIEKICLNGVSKELRRRLGARDSQMEWRVKKFVSTRIISHRASPLDLDAFPETGYRQAVVRIETDQELRMTAPTKFAGSNSHETSHLQWKPKGVRNQAKQHSSIKTSGEITHSKRVVEYIVLQKRMLRGEEDKEWKIWGFTNESTPQSIQEEEDFEKKMVEWQEYQST